MGRQPTGPGRGKGGIEGLGRPRPGRPGARALPPLEDEFDLLEAAEETADEERESPRPTIPFTLPSGHCVHCLDEDETKLCQDTAYPYLEVAEEIPAEAWLHIKGYLDLVLMRERAITQTRDVRFLSRLDVRSQKELRQSIISMTSEIGEFAKRLDPLKAARGDTGESPAEWRASVERSALEYAMTHTGEFTWQAQCPAPDCQFHRQPFLMLMEVPHFAMDPAAGPGVVWNEQVAQLVHRHYCKKPAYECHHPSHRLPFSGSLSCRDAAAILRISPIGLIAIAQLDRDNYDLGFPEPADLDKPDTFRKYIV